MTTEANLPDKPWAGRFSRPSSDHECEAYVVLVMRRAADDGKWQEEERLVFPFPNEHLALRRAEQLVEDYLAAVQQPGMSAAELFARYRREGPDPYIRYQNLGYAAQHYAELPFLDMAVAFDAWQYAETACKRVCAEAPTGPSGSLSYLQGRYDDYDRKRLESNLLLGRQVRLTRECSGGIGRFPAGTEGVVGRHAQYIDWEIFDWRRELPMILRQGNLSVVRHCFGCLFDQPDNRPEVTFGIPYDALEFSQSHEEFCKSQMREGREE